jgi:hypothetical protein
MSDAISGSDRFPIAPRQTPVELNISAYWADTSEKVTAKAIKDPKYASNRVDILSVCLVFTKVEVKEMIVPPRPLDHRQLHLKFLTTSLTL